MQNMKKKSKTRRRKENHKKKQQKLIHKFAFSNTTEYVDIMLYGRKVRAYLKNIEIDPVEVGSIATFTITMGGNL